MATADGVDGAVVTQSRGATGGVQSVERSLDVLEALSGAGGEMGISELASATGLPLPTIHRLLRTLVARGYVRQQENRRYALGPRLVPLGERAALMVGLWVRPLLTRAMRQIGESINVASTDGDQAVYVAQVESSHAMRMFNEVGRRVRLHSTGVGKALLSQLTDAEATDVLLRAGMPARTPKTITDVDAMLAQLAVIRERGYAEDDEEQELGVRCVAVPVRIGVSRFAVSTSAPAPRLTTERIGEVVNVLRALADEITRAGAGDTETSGTTVA